MNQRQVARIEKLGLKKGEEPEHLEPGGQGHIVLPLASRDLVMIGKVGRKH